MITFWSIVALICAAAAKWWLESEGSYDVHIHRWTDLLVLVPGYGGIFGLVYVTWTLMSRWLP